MSDSTLPQPAERSGSKFERGAVLALLCAQIGILFTGAVVRVTGSGLGCVTWPNCQPGSLIPVAGAQPWIHQAIEFGNRMLTFVLVAVAIAAFVAVVQHKRRKPLILHAIAQGVGIIVQAVIGGISVHLDLQWWSVALHFLPSSILVWLAAIFYIRVSEPDDGTPTPQYPRPLRLLAIGSALAMAVVLITGTMTTGAGPHAGDSKAGMQGRLNVSIAEMAHVHAHFMYLFLGLSIGLVVALVTVRASRPALRHGGWLLGIIVVQGAIGILQYRFGVPRWTVPVHVVLSGVVTAFAGFVYAYGSRRELSAKAQANLIHGDAPRAAAATA